jgi:undecaprenyl-diphosphatase
LAGYFGADFFESLFAEPRLVGFTLIATGIILLSTLLARKGDKSVWDCHWLRAFLVGCAQAVAILPGISRSGSTITTGLHLGFKGEESARFSFLLSIPAILGAAILEGRRITSIPQGEIIPLILGMASAMVVGYLAIWAMMRILRRGELYYFAPYCIVMGSILLIFI